MQIARINAKGQTTIPASIRKAANMNEGDTLKHAIADLQSMVEVGRMVFVADS